MLFIFDWDGTLCDSADKIITAMHDAGAELNLPTLTDDCVREIIGLGLPEVVAKLYPHIDPAKMDDMRAAYSRHFVEADKTPCDFFPGVEDTLSKIVDSGHQIAVATGKTRKGLDRMLANMGMTDFFHSTRCADETASKPHPKMLFELLQERQFKVEQAVMIGDTEYDMEMARRADMPRVAVDYGAHHIDRLRNYAPLLCASSIDQLLELI